MKSTVEQLSPTRVKINVEVPFDELKPNFDRAYRKIAQQVRIPGFRPGKVPAKVLESRIGRAPVLDEVINEAIPAKYIEAVQADDVKTLGQPELDVTNIEDGKSVTFTAEVDVRPEITVPTTDGLTVSVDKIEVDDAQVDEELDNLRARFGTLTGVERPAQDGDFVSIDISATVDGQDVPEAATEGLSYEIGSGQLIEGIDEALIGLGVGEEKEFTTKLVAGEYAGKDAEVTVKVQSVKERELPEADDEFAQMASEFDTIDELKSDLRTRIGSVNQMQQGVQARDKVLEALLEAAEIPLPETVVNDEIERRKHDAVHQFDHDEEAFKQALEAEGKTLEEFETEAREESEKAVKAQLLLDTIADDNEVQVGDQELTERIIYQAQRFGVSPDEYVQRAQQSGQLGAIYADVRRGKALATVVREVKVTDSDGNDVDLGDLFDDKSEAAAEPAAEAVETTDEETTETAPAGDR